MGYAGPPQQQSQPSQLAQRQEQRYQPVSNAFDETTYQATEEQTGYQFGTEQTALKISQTLDSQFANLSVTEPQITPEQA